MPVIEVRELTSFWTRLRGLLGTDIDSGSLPVLLRPCRGIHTYGMRYAIDVAHLNKAGRVIQTARALRPNRRSQASQSVCVLERPASSKPWPKPGQVVEIVRKPSAGGGVGTYVKF